jgi:hypothetical protein
MSKAPPYITPPPYELADVAALQALAQGTATADQQKWALDWIIIQAAGTYNLSFDTASERGTAFAEGRRFVGLQIVKMLKLDRGKLKD